MKRFSRLLLAAAATMALSQAAMAQFTITDLNSSATINPGSQAGMSNWTVDGVNHMFQQWFWYRIGTSGGEAAINTISPAVGGGAGNVAQLTYTNAMIKVETTYILTGGGNGSGQSDIIESIRITNMDQDANTFHFFQYTDFDLGGTAGGDTVIRTNANTFDQWDGVMGASETISTPVASHWEAGNFPGLLSSLGDANPTTLADIGSGTTGDCTFAWQWDFNLNPGETFLISKDKNITPVPEPATFVVIGIGLAALAAKRRK